VAVSYRGQVTTLFEVLAEGLAPFVDARMSQTFPGEDWILMAAHKLGKRPDVLVSLSDPHFQLEVINRWWGPAFAPVLDEESRQVVGELRTARNHWAHPDEDHPIDLDYAVRVHRWAGELLRGVGSPRAEEVDALLADVRRQGVRHAAQEAGMSETEALISQLTELEERYEHLQHRLDEARQDARSASGRTRAVARQLAELQTQYAAVAGLRDDYLDLQQQISAGSAGDAPDPSSGEVLRRQLAAAEASMLGLQRESLLLRSQLSRARDSLEDIDPLATPAGRRLLWLVSSLLLVVVLIVAMTVTFV
jgi:hypothetical protein